MERTRPHATTANATAEPVIPGEGFVRNMSEEDIPILVPMRTAFSMSKGMTITAPEGTYTIEGAIGGGNEGISYLATIGGEKKVLKVDREKTGGLEHKLESQLLRANKALDTDMSLLRLNAYDYALVRDYVEGETLSEHVKNAKRTITQREALTMIEHVVREYLMPLHAEKLVHRDIKPSNIIVGEEDGQKIYTLIDFGLLRENGVEATMKGKDFEGTAGYTRLTSDHKVQNDYYSLAETAIFAITGEHAKFVGVDDLDKQDDERKIAKMAIAPAFKELLLQMLSHRGTFDEPTDVLRSIEKVKKGFNGNADTSIDLVSANELTQYRKRATPPETLLAEIEGLKAIFKEEYSASILTRNPLSPEFNARCKETLKRLGYEDHTSSLPGVFMRKRKDSTLVDVLRLNEKGKTYFDAYRVDGEQNNNIIEVLKDALPPKKEVYELARYVGSGLQVLTYTSTGVLLGGNHPVVGGVLGTLGGIISHLISITDEGSRGLSYDRELSDPLWKGFLPWNLHHLYAKTAYTLTDWKHKAGIGMQRSYNALGRDDQSRLEEALTPAPLFTYDENPAQVSTQIAQPVAVQEAPAHHVRLSNWV